MSEIRQEDHDAVNRHFNQLEGRTFFDTALYLAAELREAKEALAIKEELKADPRDASQTAMDEIQEACGYYKEPWEYPGQVVRDVSRMRAERDALSAENAELKGAVVERDDVLRSLASWLGNGGYNAPTVDPAVFEAKIRDGVDNMLRVEINRALSNADTRAHEFWRHTGTWKSLREAIHGGPAAWESTAHLVTKVNAEQDRKEGE